MIAPNAYLKHRVLKGRSEVLTSLRGALHSGFQGLFYSYNKPWRMRSGLERPPRKRKLGSSNPIRDRALNSKKFGCDSSTAGH